MTLLALDVSTAQTGYCVGVKGGRPRWGVFRPKTSWTREERIAFMAASVAHLAKAMHVKEVVAEEVSVTSFKKADGSKSAGNFKTAEALAECRGVIKYLLRPLLLRVEDVNLSSARSRLGIRTHFGPDFKGQVKKADVIKWLRDNSIPVDNGDEADAIVVWLARSLGRA